MHAYKRTLQIGEFFECNMVQFYYTVEEITMSKHLVLQTNNTKVNAAFQFEHSLTTIIAIFFRINMKNQNNKFASKG